MRPRAALIVVLLGVAGAATCWFALREPQPQYKGRSLSYWVEAYSSGQVEEVLRAEEAIQKIGTNAFPMLLQWIREPEPRRHSLLVGVARMLPRPVRPKWSFADYLPLSYASAYAFKALGTQAFPIVPELSVIGADPTNRDCARRALGALAYIGSNGVPALLTVLRDPSHPHRDHAAFALGASYDLGPYTNAVVSELIMRLDDHSVGEPIARNAAKTLGNLKARPDLVVPALAHCLENTNNNPELRRAAAGSLRWFAFPALPYLTNALNDPEPAVRATAKFGIDQIYLEMQSK